MNNPIMDIKLQHDIELLIHRSNEQGEDVADLAKDILAFLDARYTFTARG